MGPQPVGTLTYGAKGHMSVLVMRSYRPPFASGDYRRGTDVEVRTAFEGSTGYAGTYSFDAQRRVVVHRIEVAPFPNYVGTALERFVTLEGNRLTWRTPSRVMGGEAGTATLIWERVD